MVEQRRNEIGLRMALRADRGSVIGLVIRAGTALALWTARAAPALLFGFRPYGPATLVTACAVLASVGMVANYAPAGSASRIDPMQALREE